MKIGIDCRLWGETGVGRYIRNLVSELQKIDTKNEYVLLALSNDIEKIKSVINPSTSLREKNKWSLVTADIHWHSIQEQFEFPKILEKENLDLVHFPYFSMPIFYKGKYVLTIHDLIINHFPTGKASTLPWLIYYFKYIAYKYVLLQAVKNADKIITVSHATEKEIQDHYHVPKDKLTVTYEGVDHNLELGIKNYESSSKSNGQKIEVQSKTKLLATNYFLYVGNAYPHKNLELLIEAMSLVISHSGDERREDSRINPSTALRERIDSGQVLRSPQDIARMTSENNNNLKLILVGKEDHFYKKLEAKVREMGLEQNILFRHDVNDQDLALLYRNALALVASSLMEGFGLPLLEAMANNCLVVASDIPVFHEVCGDAAIYVDPYDKEAMVNILLSVYNKQVKNENEKKKIGKNRVSLFSWEKMAEETLGVYKSCFGIRQSK